MRVTLIAKCAVYESKINGLMKVKFLSRESAKVEAMPAGSELVGGGWRAVVKCCNGFDGVRRETVWSLIAQRKDGKEICRSALRRRPIIVL